MLPPICRYMSKPVPVVGGWMYSAVLSLLDNSENTELAVATVYRGQSLVKTTIDGVTYYLLPLKGNNSYYHKELELLWKKVNNDFLPDIVHLHGTEFAHGLAFLKSCSAVKTVVSIQGLVSSIAKYYYADIPFSSIIKNLTFRDIVKGGIIRTRRDYFRRGKIEHEIICRAKNIIGRTSWDKAQIWAINPNANYFFCNETLRSSFYEKQWDYKKCEPHSIFISQAKNPIKGLHQLLKAMPLILNCYPNSKIYVSGDNITLCKTLNQRLRFSGYGSYIKKLIEEKGLKEKVIFLGPLDETQMCNRFLSSNVFVCPSSIENSPNSLGEAQLLGVPCVASFVGGIPDFMVGCEKRMYRFDDYEMLAKQVCDIFSLSGNINVEDVRALARCRHDKKKNSRNLMNIYKQICENGSSSFC